MHKESNTLSTTQNVDLSKAIQESGSTRKKPKKVLNLEGNKQTGGKYAKPIRTRPGKAFPGGRTLRRALANLSARRRAFKEASGYTNPGSMK